MMRQKQFYTEGASYRSGAHLMATLLMWLLLAAWLMPQSLHAQTVATEATALENLKSGYYALVMRTTKTPTAYLDVSRSDGNGTFIYYNADDKTARYDREPSLAHPKENNLRGVKLKRDSYKYVFYIDKDDAGKFTVKAWDRDKLYWPSVPEPEKVKGKSNPGDQSRFIMSGSPLSFRCEKNGDWQRFIADVKRCRWYNNTEYLDPQVDPIYVSLVEGATGDDGHAFKIGYHYIVYDVAHDVYHEPCEFQFYAVDDMPDPEEVVNVTYNYKYEGKISRTQTFDDARIGRAYPDADLPDFAKAEKPAGNVMGESTFDLDVKLQLPFELSKEGDYHYYYLENIQGDGTRIYYVDFKNDGTVTDLQGYRPCAQTETINNLHNDLWYVTGNPFDGYEFHSVGANKTLKSFTEMNIITKGTYLTFTPYSKVSFSAVASNWELYQIISGNDKVFGVVPHNGSYAVGDKEYSWKLNRLVGFGIPDGEDEACAFRLVPATFTYQLSKGVDGHTYGTLSTPFDVKVEGESDVKMYKGAAEYDELSLDEVVAAPAGAGVLLRGDTSEEVTLAVTSGAAALGNNVLVGNLSDVTDLSDKLILGTSSATGKVGFYPAADGVTTLAANQAYILRSSASLPEGLYISSGNESDISWTLSDDGVLTVTGTGKMSNYNEKDKLSPWHDKKSAIKKVVIGEGISKIGTYAFFGCTGLSEVQLPGTLKTIGNYAFTNCGMIRKTLQLPEGLESIGTAAFGVTLLSSIGLPESLKSIGDSAFYGNYMQSIYIPRSVTYLGNQFCGNRLNSLSSITVHADNAVYTSKGTDGKECNAIISKEADANRDVTLLLGCGRTIIPENVTIIGDGAFQKSADFRNNGKCEIPNQVKRIGAGAFANCEMRYLIIGSGVKTIKSGAFRSCSSWREVVSLAEEVPACEADAFSGAKNCTLRVPSKSAEKYKTDAVWGKAFSGNIKKDVHVYAKLSGNGVPGTEDAFITLQLYCDNNDDFTEEDVDLIDDIPDNFKMADLAKGLGEYMAAQGYELDPLDDMQPLRYVKEIILNESLQNYAPTSCQSMFGGLYQLGAITNLKYLNTSNVIDMSSMFSDCPVTTLDLSAFDTRNVTTMASMFARCKNIKCFDVSTFNTEKVTSMNRMFFQNQKTFPTDVEIFVGDKFTMASVTDQEKMFCNETATDKGNYQTGYLQKKVGVLDGKPLGAKGSELTIETLSLTDASSYSLTETEPVMVKAATYSRSMTNKWGTLCLPYPINGNNADCQFYSIEDVSGNIIVLNRLSGTIEAGTPVLFCQNASDGTQAQTITLSGSGMLAGNAIEGTKTARLVGTFKEKVLSNGNYFIANNSFRLVDATHKAKVGAYRAYIVYEPVAEAAPATLSIGMDFTPTDINATKWLDDLNDGKAEYYDVNGVRTNGLQKGMNIVKIGGKTKKVLVK